MLLPYEKYNPGRGEDAEVIKPDSQELCDDKSKRCVEGGFGYNTRLTRVEKVSEGTWRRY